MQATMLGSAGIEFADVVKPAHIYTFAYLRTSSSKLPSGIEVPMKLDRVPC